MSEYMLNIFDGYIKLRSSDKDGNAVFFDELSDIGIDETVLFESVQKLLATGYETARKSVSFYNIEVRKSLPQFEFSSHYDIVMPESDVFRLSDIIVKRKNESIPSMITEDFSGEKGAFEFFNDLFKISDSDCEWIANFIFKHAEVMGNKRVYFSFGKDLTVTIATFDKEGKYTRFSEKLSQKKAVQIAAKNVLTAIHKKLVKLVGASSNFQEDGSGQSIINFDFVTEKKAEQ